MGEAILTPAELAEIAAYHHPKYVWGVVSEVYDLVLIALMIGLLIRPLYRWSERSAAAIESRYGFLRNSPGARVVLRALDVLWRGRGWGTALIFAFFTWLYLVIANVPTALYFEWHERRFELSTYTNAAFAWDWTKGFLSTTVLRATLAFGMYGLARRLQHWWVPLGLSCGALMLVASAMDPYRGQMYFEQAPLQAGALRTRLEAVLEKAQVDYADIRVEKTSRASRKLQAYFAGQGPTRTIVLNDVALEQFTEDEVVAAVAHEAGHVQESKWANRVAAALALPAFLGFLAWLFKLAHQRRWWGVTSRADIRTLPMATFSIYLLLSVTAPITGYFSREREREADAAALALTGDAAAFRSMLVKACRVNKMDPDPPAWFVYRSGTHPPMVERIGFAERWAAERATPAAEPIRSP